MLSNCNLIQILNVRFFSYIDNVNGMYEAIHEKLERLERNAIVLTATGGIEVSRNIQNVQLGEIINRVFKCLVCHSLATSPVCITQCCKQVLGCANCLQQWFVNNNSCPHCRADIGLEEMQTVVTGAFDEILAKCRQLFDM